MKQIKEILFKKCEEYLESKARTLKLALNDAKEAANNETKSTAGDKHETSRAIMQFEQEKLSGQLADIDKLTEQLYKVKSVKTNTSIITSGSIAITSNGNFYISISVGKIEIDKEIYFAISANAPIGMSLLGKKVNEEFVFNGNKIKIQKIL